MASLKKKMKSIAKSSTAGANLQNMKELKSIEKSKSASLNYRMEPMIQYNRSKMIESEKLAAGLIFGGD